MYISIFCCFCIVKDTIIYPHNEYIVKKKFKRGRKDGYKRRAHETRNMGYGRKSKLSELVLEFSLFVEKEEAKFIKGV